MTRTILLALAACVLAVPARCYPGCPGLCPPFFPPPSCEWPAPSPFHRPAPPPDACCGLLRDALADELLYRALLLRRPPAAGFLSGYPGSLGEPALPARLPPRRRHAEQLDWRPEQREPRRGPHDAPHQESVPLPSQEQDELFFDKLVSERGPRADVSSEPDNTSRPADDNNNNDPSPPWARAPPAYQMWEPYSRHAGLAVPGKWQLQEDRSSSSAAAAAPLSKDLESFRDASLPEDLGRHDRVQVESVWPHPSFNRRAAELLVDASRGAVSTTAASEDSGGRSSASSTSSAAEGRPGPAPSANQASDLRNYLAGSLFDKAFNYYPDQHYKSRFVL
ncbi:uncharacterized protein LOC134538347 [Bacillus rossius redtenbacheri]|uniref:uncharacterized protein LOC134538347 n=1 Tax=Bacillus rossius redtenbacheri TaxID=93214 RepID=UPI002FDE2E58